VGVSTLVSLARFYLQDKKQKSLIESKAW
jgi:hypothetical protein